MRESDGRRRLRKVKVLSRTAIDSNNAWPGHVAAMCFCGELDGGAGPGHSIRSRALRTATIEEDRTRTRTCATHAQPRARATGPHSPPYRNPPFPSMPPR
eukprot:4942928-Pleurochrysis_carterae.AAC.4